MHELLIAGADRSAIAQGTLDAMFRFRHRVFFEDLGWEVGSQDGQERDLYDEQHPVYMIVRDEQQQVIGCWRLLPTTGPYMLRDTFPQLLRGEPAPAAARVWEISRFAVRLGDGGRRAQVQLGAVTRLFIRSAVDYAVEHGIERYVFVTSVAVERLLKRMRIPLQRFGDGQAQWIGNVLSVACRVEVDDRLRVVARQLAGHDSIRAAA